MLIILDSFIKNYFHILKLLSKILYHVERKMKTLINWKNFSPLGENMARASEELNNVTSLNHNFHIILFYIRLGKESVSKQNSMVGNVRELEVHNILILKE